MWQGAAGRGVLIAAVLVALARPAPAAADIVVNPAGKPKATVLVAHMGGWIFGDATTSLPVARYLAAHGYRAVSIDFPLLDVAQSYRYATREAGHYHATFAVGESSGGTIASWLAARRRVKAAVDVSGPEDLPRWQATSLPPHFLENVGLPGRAAWDWSPVLRYTTRSAPLLGIYWRHDPGVPLEQGEEIARRGAKLEVLEGDQHVGATYYPTALRFIDAARRRIARRAAAPHRPR